jgi:hypothetical protein
MVLVGVFSSEGWALVNSLPLAFFIWNKNEYKLKSEC